MNNCIFSGRVGGDLELRHTAEGMAVTNFSIAVSRGKDKNNEYKEPLWIDLVAWDKKAELYHKYLKKGKKVQIRAVADFQEFTNKEDKNQRKIIFTVIEAEFDVEKNSTDKEAQ